MSTADTYIIGAVNSFYEDILCRSLHQDGPKDEKALGLLRSVATTFSMSILLMVFVNPNFETLFLYMFYSANGFVGPILFALLKKQINFYAVVISMIFGFTYPAISIFAQNTEYIGKYPGIVPVVFSVVIVAFWPTKTMESANA